MIGRESNKTDRQTDSMIVIVIVVLVVVAVMVAWLKEIRCVLASSWADTPSASQCKAIISKPRAVQSLSGCAT